MTARLTLGFLAGLLLGAALILLLSLMIGTPIAGAAQATFLTFPAILGLMAGVASLECKP
jgi:hypothetical protein